MDRYVLVTLGGYIPIAAAWFAAFVVVVAVAVLLLTRCCLSGRVVDWHT